MAGQQKARVKSMYDSRLKRYKSVADLEVDTGSGLEETIKTIWNFTR